MLEPVRSMQDVLLILLVPLVARFGPGPVRRNNPNFPCQLAARRITILEVKLNGHVWCNRENVVQQNLRPCSIVRSNTQSRSRSLRAVGASQRHIA